MIRWLLSLLGSSSGDEPTPFDRFAEPEASNPVENARRVLSLALREADGYAQLREYVRRALEELERAD